MTIQLVEAKDCRKRRPNKVIANNITNNIVNETINNDIDCSSTDQLKTENLIGHEKGCTIRLGKIPIYNCKYYDIENNFCLIYYNRSCFNCKKKNIEKMTNREKGFIKKIMKK